jgi:hypothetical protein
MNSQRNHMEEEMEEIAADEHTRTVDIKDADHRWTFHAKLTYIVNSAGVPPHSPTPHFPPIPVNAVLGAVEDLLTATSGESLASRSNVEFLGNNLARHSNLART